MIQALAVSALLASAAGQLIVDTHRHRPIERHFQQLIPNTLGQKPLASSQEHHDVPPFKAGQFTKKLQGNETCPTYGESQWTGTIDVTDKHRLFYWYFDSRNDPANDPIIIWMNGGPGGSSMMGLFNEMGPCWLDVKTDLPSPNKWAWNNNASVLFLDQPAGVGFSSLAAGAPHPTKDMDGAEDFQQFLNIFFSKVLPEKKSLPIHIAAESYGGHYGPVYVNHILNSRRYQSKNAFWGNITSMILIDAVLDFTGPAVGVYELLCEDVEKTNILNHTACEKIAQGMPEVQKLGQNCDAANDGKECLAMITYSAEKIHVFYSDLVEAGKRHMYNIHLPCPNPPDCRDITKGNFTQYLNLDRVRKALDVPASKIFSDINWAINRGYSDYGDPWKPTSKEVAAILEAYNELPYIGDIKLMVLNGNADYIVNTPGNIWTYDNLRWSGQAEYRIKKWRPFPEGIAATGKWKALKNGRLAFVAVDGAGHTVPGD
ncbi:hypothetical protein QQS21_012924, partial [Conoideocrella luteorostrata]